MGRGSWAVSLVVLIAVPACTKGQKAEEKEVITSLTIFPVTAVGEQHKNFGEALGLLIEKNGFRGIEIAATTFRPEDDSDFDKVAASFGSFVTEKPIKTEFALYCEFQGTPKGGVEGVRGVIVDRKGQLVWKEVQTPEDADFKRIKPSCPMTCCVLMSERLRPLLVMASPEELEQEGEMARLWARKSGTPAAEEFDAMKARQGKMREAGAKSSVVVYPIRIGKEVDRQGAGHLASLLNEQKLCRARVADEPISFEVQPDSNEQRMLWDMAKAFQSNLQKKTPAADYSLYGDYVITPAGKIWAVHFAVCNRAGEFVIVDFQNDHHGDFQAISPKSLEDCNRLTTRRLAGYLK